MHMPLPVKNQCCGSRSGKSVINWPPVSGSLIFYQRFKENTVNYFIIFNDLLPIYQYMFSMATEMSRYDSDTAGFLR
jgi:hypothetical protein